MAENFYNYNNLEHYFNELGLNYPTQYLRWVKEIVGTKVTMFHYGNLPGSLTSEILEKGVMFNNFLCFWKMPGDVPGLYRYRFGSDYDMYWKPKVVTILTLSGKVVANNVPYEDIVLVRDNPMDIIPFITLNDWVTKIIEKEKTLDILLTWLRFPAIMEGEKDEVAQLKATIKKAFDFTPVMIGSKNFKSKLEQFDVKLPVRLIEIYELIEKYKNMALSSMGIYGVDEKRERIVTSEVEANNDFVDFVYSGMYQERKRFVEEANKKWNLNIELFETYVENEQDNIKALMEREKAKSDAKIKLEQVKNEGKIEAAKVEGIEAAKIEGINKEDNDNAK